MPGLAVVAFLSLVAAAAQETAPSPRFVRTTPIAGRVVDERRFPVAGARVFAEQLGAPEPLATTSGPDGAFAFDVAALRGDGVIVALVATGSDGRIAFDQAFVRADFPIAARPLDLCLAPGVRVQLAVTAQGRPAAGALVAIGLPYAPAIASTTCDANGRGTIGPIPAGSWTLVARHAELGVRRERIDARADEALERTVELRRRETLAVRVVDVADGSPIGGATISVEMAEGDDESAGQPGAELAARGAPLITGPDGTLDVGEVEAGTSWCVSCSAPHFSSVDGLSDLGIGVPSEDASQPATRRLVRAGSGLVYLSLKKLVPTTVRIPIDPASAVVPPDGSELDLHVGGSLPLDGSQHAPSVPARAVVRDGAIVATIEFGPTIRPFAFEEQDPTRFFGTLVSRSAAEPCFVGRVEPPPRDQPGDGRAWFERASSLAITLRAANDEPVAGDAITVSRDVAAKGFRLDRVATSFVSDAHGVVSLRRLVPGRYSILWNRRHREIDLAPGVAAVGTLAGRASFLEPIVFECVVAGERRLPGRFDLHVPEERIELRREEPQRGEIHVVRRGEASLPASWISFFVDGRSIRLTERPAGSDGARRFAATIPARNARARLRYAPPAAPPAGASLNLRVERLDPTRGRFEHDVDSTSRLLEALPHAVSDAVEQRIGPLSPGTLRLVLGAGVIVGAPATVTDDGSEPLLELDASQLVEVNVVFRVPDGENGDFLAVAATPKLAFDEIPRASIESGYLAGDSWPFLPLPAAGKFQFDRRSPPRLAIEHPYLVGAPENDAIDLANPRSTITLHVKAGAFASFVPSFDAVPERAAAANALRGAWLRFHRDGEDAAGGPALPALRRGDRFVFAPPAGRAALLIDPIVAAPVELPPVAFDGKPLELGTIAFARGSTLRIHVRAPAPFAPPSICAGAERLDGLTYRRSSPNPVRLPIATRPPPGEATLEALGAGHFRVTVQDTDEWGHELEREVELDGIHDAELTFDLD